jgi:hypothetical protein
MMVLSVGQETCSMLHSRDLLRAESGEQQA